MKWVRVVLAAPLLLSALVAEPQARQQSPAPAATDLIPVDAAVVDDSGDPVPGLGPDQFDVIIGGRARRVVTAAFVDAARANAAGIPGPDASGGRLFVIAIDLSSFNALESVAICVAAQSLVDHLALTDRVSVVTYPSGVTLDPTTDRVAIRKALETVVVQSPFSPSAPPPELAAKLPDQGELTRKGLESLLAVVGRLAAIDERKIVVLVSPGIPGTAEEVVDLPGRISRQAAVSNAVIYGVYVDRGFIDLTIPEKDRIAMISPTRELPPNLLVRWMDRVATPSGGAVFQVNGINPEPLLARMANETSGYYRLGVDGADIDRSNTVRDLSVTLKSPGAPGASVRAKGWVVTSRRVGGPTADAAVVRPAPAAAPMPPPARPSSDPILAAYERGEYATVQERLGRQPELAKWIHAYRSDDRPWPATPRRAAVFSLEIAAAALQTTSGAARDEAVKLLLEQSAAIRAGVFTDTFACLWYWGALMLFEGSEHPEEAGPLLTRAIARCPSQARIALANAVLLDQGAPVLVGGIRVGAAAAAEEAAFKSVVAAYQAAMKFPETDTEARVRQANFFLRLKRFDEALNVLAEVGSPAPAAPTLEESLGRQVDRQVRYIGHLVEGHALRAKGRLSQAAASYRLAMQDWPGAQAARLALMTLLAVQDRTEEAAALASAIETAPEDTSDPWWWFWQGDRVLYPTLIASLRENTP